MGGRDIYLQGKTDGKVELLRQLLDKGQYVESTFDNTMSGGEIYWGLLKEDFEKLLKQFGLELR